MGNVPPLHTESVRLDMAVFRLVIKKKSANFDETEISRQLVLYNLREAGKLGGTDMMEHLLALIEPHSMPHVVVRSPIDYRTLLRLVATETKNRCYCWLLVDKTVYNRLNELGLKTTFKWKVLYHAFPGLQYIKEIQKLFHLILMCTNDEKTGYFRESFHQLEPEEEPAPVECMICEDNKINIRLICGHKIMCEECVKSMCEGPNPNCFCPVCRMAITTYGWVPDTSDERLYRPPKGPPVKYQKWM